MNLVELIEHLKEISSSIENPEKCEVVRFKNINIDSCVTNDFHENIIPYNKENIVICKYSKGNVNREYLEIDIPFIATI